MTITVLLTCHKTGPHLDDTLRSLYASAARAPSVKVTIRILSPLPAEELSKVSQPPATRQDLKPRQFATAQVGGILAKFDEYLAATPMEDPSEVVVFSNDDVIFAPSFLENLMSIDLSDRIVGPVIRTSSGVWQTSMFRKRFSFWRLMFRIHDGGLYSRFITLPDTLAGINDGRTTVDGCCFIMNERTLRRFGRRFNFVAFLYMEEVLFQVLHDRLGIRSEVVESLEITHLGGASLTHIWSTAKSQTQLDSVTAVSRAYLGHAAWQTAVLRAWFHFESLARRALTRLMS